MIYILLPAYNESSSFPSLIPKLSRTLEQANEQYKIIVCNDGSTDSSEEILNELSDKYPLVVLKHDINRGLGETSRDLFEYSASVSEKGDVIIRLDCDDTHEPEFIVSMLEKVRSGSDVVIASRFVEGGGQLGLNAYRRWISMLANLFMKIFFPIRGIREYSCGFRAYKAEIIKRAIDFYGNNFIQLKGLGFTCTLEKLVKLKMLGATFDEVPFVLRYDQKKSDSKMISSVTTYGYISLAILYHWPWGGWRSQYKKKLKERH